MELLFVSTSALLASALIIPSFITVIEVDSKMIKKDAGKFMLVEISDFRGKEILKNVIVNKNNDSQRLLIEADTHKAGGQGENGRRG